MKFLFFNAFNVPVTSNGYLGAQATAALHVMVFP